MSGLKYSIKTVLGAGTCLTLLSSVFAVHLVYAQAGSSEPLRLFSDQQYSGGVAKPSQEALLPAGVIRLADSEQYLLWVELNTGKLHLLERIATGGMITRQIIPVSIGKNGVGKLIEGDRKTPVGVYRLTSFLKDQQLDDYYGLGAYPLNYPNISDRQLGRTGSGIWLHGLPKGTESRPLLDSDGCIVIANDSLQELAQYVNIGVTHIVLSDKPLIWKEKEKSEIPLTTLTQAFESWKIAWENRDNRTYLGFYANDFSDFRRNKQQWDEYKSRINNSKRWIEVDTSNASFFADLNEPNLVTVRFLQDYKSSNYNWQGWKEQLWRETAKGWKIVYEGNG